MEKSKPSYPIGIIAGENLLPVRVVEYCKKHGKDFYVVYIKSPDNDPPSYLSKIPHSIFSVGQVGKVIKVFKDRGIEHITFVGKTPRVSLKNLSVDLLGARLIANITKNISQGDNAMLSTIIDFFSNQGFKVLGAHEIVRELLAPKGVIGKIKPKKQYIKDIEYGKNIAHKMGDLDIGQSVVIMNSSVLGVEAAEGTDGLIKRCKILQTKGLGAVLVKMKKPKQDPRIDLPTIGVTTIRNIASAGFSGVAVEAGATLIIDLDKVIAEANKQKVFLVGV